MVCFFFCGSQSKNYIARKLNRGRNRKDGGGEKKGDQRQLENFRPLAYPFLFLSRFSFRVAELLYAPINGLPQDGEGRGEGVAGNPREIWHFQVFKCQFPQLVNP